MTISELNKILQLDPGAFNRTKRGWKQFTLKNQIIVITAYLLRYAHHGKWNSETPKGVHEETTQDIRMNLARCLAKAGDAREATIQFEQCTDDKHRKEVEATIAYLKNDKATFDKVYDKEDKLHQKIKDNWTSTYEEITRES